MESLKEKKSSTPKDYEISDSLVKLLAVNSAHESNLYLQHLGARFDFLNFLRDKKEEEEPLPIFKKKHKQWEIELKELENQITDVLKKMDDEVEELEVYHDIVNPTKKETA